MLGSSRHIGGETWAKPDHMVGPDGVWRSVYARPRVVAVTMIKITITLRLKRQVWFVVACEVDSADGGQPLSLPPLLKRKFYSYEAATHYVKRIVLGRLKRLRPNAAGSDMTCYVNVLSPEEKL